MKPNKSSREWPFRIKDILHAIDKIEQYTQHMTASEFRMVALRNFLAHEYFGVDLKTVWETVRIHLPALKQQLLELPKKFG